MAVAGGSDSFRVWGQPFKQLVAFHQDVGRAVDVHRFRTLFILPIDEIAAKRGSTNVFTRSGKLLPDTLYDWLMRCTAPGGSAVLSVRFNNAFRR